MKTISCLSELFCFISTCIKCLIYGKVNAQRRYILFHKLTSRLLLLFHMSYLIFWDHIWDREKEEGANRRNIGRGS